MHDGVFVARMISDSEPTSLCGRVHDVGQIPKLTCKPSGCVFEVIRPLLQCYSKVQLRDKRGIVLFEVEEHWANAVLQGSLVGPKT